MSEQNGGAVTGLSHRGDEPHLFREIVRTYQALVTGFARQTGVSASRFALMRQLALSDAGLGLAELARQLEVNPAAVTRLVQEMQAERLVTRQADANDGRRSYVRLSSKGRKQFAALHKRTHTLERSLAAAIGAKAMAEAATTLANVRAHVEGSR